MHEKNTTRGMSSYNSQISDNRPSMCSMTGGGSKEEWALGLLRSSIKGNRNQLTFI